MMRVETEMLQIRALLQWIALYPILRLQTLVSSLGLKTGNSMAIVALTKMGSPMTIDWYLKLITMTKVKGKSTIEMKMLFWIPTNCNPAPSEKLTLESVRGTTTRVFPKLAKQAEIDIILVEVIYHLRLLLRIVMLQLAISMFWMKKRIWFSHQFAKMKRWQGETNVLGRLVLHPQKSNSRTRIFLLARVLIIVPPLCYRRVKTCRISSNFAVKEMLNRIIPLITVVTNTEGVKRMSLISRQVV
mmetsp:Transcript_22422/g.46601  ORF Transcript_22422/g.46601 Transcript_22422/m.46601 type:complete len:244 (+) Transcript_22422:87-818(+)